MVHTKNEVGALDTGVSAQKLLCTKHKTNGMHTKIRWVKSHSRPEVY